MLPRYKTDGRCVLPAQICQMANQVLKAPRREAADRMCCRPNVHALIHSVTPQRRTGLKATMATARKVGPGAEGLSSPSTNPRPPMTGRSRRGADGQLVKACRNLVKIRGLPGARCDTVTIHRTGFGVCAGPESNEGTGEAAMATSTSCRKPDERMSMNSLMQFPQGNSEARREARPSRSETGRTPISGEVLRCLRSNARPSQLLSPGSGPARRGAN